mmetsp:Transcript_11411/g.31134  ORF Transcript_11411/g.31134 Transcript_11411/m.31134 type:complete len:202 (+) Transcript_11411:700-1305(+)
MGALQRVAHVGHQLYGALDLVLRGQILVTSEQVVNDIADHPRREEAPQVELANKPHVCPSPVFQLLLVLLDLAGTHRLLVLLWRFQCGWQAFVLLLARVEKDPPEGHRLLALPLRWELGVARMQVLDHVGVGVAVMRLLQGLPEDDLVHSVQLLRVQDVDVSQAVHNHLLVLWHDLVQEALDAAAKLLHTVRGLCHPVPCL